MLEIPEIFALARQCNETLIGKRITCVTPTTNQQKFCWFNGDVSAYPTHLLGKTITKSTSQGMFLDLIIEDFTLSLCDGVNMRHYQPNEKLPDTFQLMIHFDDTSTLVFTVAMYGGIWLFTKTFDNIYYQNSLKSPSPLTEAFSEEYFELLFTKVKDMSVKAFLATEQRIPGLGNGSLQDILFLSKIHPKRKISTLTIIEKNTLLKTIKKTLHSMSTEGGRNTEKDLFGNYGGYKTLLSKNTVNKPCSICNDTITKESYMGGAIYFCPTCQHL